MSFQPFFFCQVDQEGDMLVFLFFASQSKKSMQTG